MAERETLTHGKDAHRRESVANRFVAGVHARRGRLELATASRGVCALLLATALAFSLSGCKDTDVLTELIYDPTSDNIDYDNPLKNWVNVAGAPEDEREENVLSKAETQAMLEQTLAEYGQDATDPEQVAQQAQTGSTQNERQASTGENAGDADSGTNVSNPSAPQDGTNGNGKGNGDGPQQTDEESLLDDNQHSPNNDGDKATGGAGGTGRVYGESDYSELPRGQRIAATGDYALITMMLAGGGDGYAPALVAADEQFLSGKAAAVFADEGIGTVSAVWSGDGSQEGQLNLQALIAAEPDIVLIGTDESSMTQEEANELQMKGVQIVIMPEMGMTVASDRGIEASVQIVGEVLRDAYTRFDAPEMAGEWKKLHDVTLQETLDLNGGIAGHYGDLDTHVRVHSSFNGNSAYASERAGKQYGLSGNYYISCYIDDWADGPSEPVLARRTWIGVVDRPPTQAEMEVDCSDGFGVVEEKAVAKSSTFSKSTMAFYLNCAGISQLDMYYPSGARIWGALDSPIHSSASHGYGESVQYRDIASVESGYYPGIIVRTQDMMSAIVRSSGKINGLWRSYASEDGLSTYPYEVYVLPDGVAGSWAHGNAESFLSVPWAYCTFQQDKDYSMCTGRMSDFYSVFYREDYAAYVDGYGVWGTTY